MALDVTTLRQVASGYADAHLIALFGSVARGAERPGSDVDVGVLGLSFWRASARRPRSAGSTWRPSSHAASRARRALMGTAADG